MFQLLRLSKLLDGAYLSADDNWEYTQKFAQLCYAPTPSLETTDPCSMRNERQGSHQISVFTAGGSQYNND
eukprot:CAMPEP_0206237898 /NCGR_PEP_ID=MMETSP0047_2-20121206/14519_1 /ASSEMBLY_ACC=CAM_ASM_000192 /TAXON_ID=195065 /ORGANISM="Chroomonas mesostigmatica_cf, Strain CCMP1168" /LENGTH=70 /DNA_ID=CAMNT_0053662381 /DNA_START=12 /DNA_END=224 /DNA_ORIENTATION=+